MTVAKYCDLVAWQKAMALVREVYKLTRTWPHEEQFGLTSQVRRAVTAVPSNIAEGHGRRTGKEFVRFLSIAHGSLMEVETQLRIGADLRYVNPEQLAHALRHSEELGRVIYGLVTSVQVKRQPTPLT